MKLVPELLFSRSPVLEEGGKGVGVEVDFRPLQELVQMRSACIRLALEPRAVDLLEMLKWFDKEIAREEAVSNAARQK